MSRYDYAILATENEVLRERCKKTSTALRAARKFLCDLQSGLVQLPEDIEETLNKINSVIK